MSITLVNVADAYRNRFAQDSAPLRKQLRRLAEAMGSRRATEIADAAAMAASVEFLLDLDNLDVEALPPEVRDAFHQAYPHVDLSAMDGIDKAELGVYLNAWKGKLFELTVRDELNAGQTVGDWTLEPGQTAELAHNVTQPGWDLLIRDDAGHAIDSIQLKATESASYVHAALERYPHIPVLTTADVAEQLQHVPEVTHAEISTHDLEDHINVDPPALEDYLDVEHYAVPLTMVAVTELLAVARGQKTAEQALTRGAERMVDGAIAGAMGTVVGTLTFGLGGIAATVATRLWLGQRRAKAKRDRVQPKVTRSTQRILSQDVQAPSQVRRRQITHRQRRQTLRWLRARYATPAPSPTSFEAQEPLAQAGAHDQLRVGMMKSTCATFVYDPTLQDAMRRDTVWLYSVRANCLSAFQRTALRQSFIPAPPSDKAKGLARFHAWKQRQGI